MSIKTSMQMISSYIYEITEATSKAVSDTLGQLGMAVGQVAGGSGQVSGDAQALAHGAAEQTNTIDELSASISKISFEEKHTIQLVEKRKMIWQHTKENTLQLKLQSTLY